MGLLILLPAVAHAETPDDPALSRAVTADAAARPDALESATSWRISGLFGWASPVVDPDVREGFGAGVQIAYGKRMAAELRSSFSYSHYEEPFDNLGLPFASGDITMGLGVPLLLRRGGRLDLFAGAGPAWMNSWLGVTWSIGTVGGLGAELALTPNFALRIEAAYHLFHLAEIGGPKFYDRNSLREVGLVDRFDLFAGPVVRL